MFTNKTYYISQIIKPHSETKIHKTTLLFLHETTQIYKSHIPKTTLIYFHKTTQIHKSHYPQNYLILFFQPKIPQIYQAPTKLPNICFLNQKHRTLSNNSKQQRKKKKLAYLRMVKLAYLRTVKLAYLRTADGQLEATKSEAAGGGHGLAGWRHCNKKIKKPTYSKKAYRR